MNGDCQDKYHTRELKNVFRVICKKCGSEDVRVELDLHTGDDSFSEVALRCNACKAEWVCYA